MTSILIIGAGRSSGALINYVLEKARVKGWFVTVADADPSLAEAKVNGHPNGRPAWLDVHKVNDRKELIGRADIVVSLLPAHLHVEVAQDCIKLNKHLITASYVSKEMYSLGDEVRDRELIFMGEMGLDPGIDHMSAMQKIDEIKAKGGKLLSFRSYTGGLVAPESDTNPWHYKFTWNPRNVILAGQGTAQYLRKKKYKFIPYNRLFRKTWDIEVPGMGPFEVYANRDSLLYREQYGLKNIPTILRGTIRYPGYCAAWNALIKIGLTDADFPILNSDKLTYHALMEAFAPEGNGSVKDRVAGMIKEKPDSEVMQKLEWLGLFSKRRIGIPNATPALILENLLLEKWKLEPADKDMIIMQHEFIYTLNGKKRKLTSSMVMKGENQHDTAMSRLVGLPMGIFVSLIAEGKIKSTGVQIPVLKEVYEPVLEELKQYGVEFTEQEEVLK
jgi:saccharopine dehydrogenase-like NADP-dependent oxidoreductase